MSRHPEPRCPAASALQSLKSRKRAKDSPRWFFLLALILGLIFGWHVAAAVLILGLIGYVGFWLFMLCKPVKGNH